MLRPEEPPPGRGETLESTFFPDSDFLRQIFDESPDAIVVVDNEDRVLQSSRGFRDLFGYSTAEARGRKINDLVARGSMASEASGVSRTVLSGEVVRLETLRTHKDGRLIPVSIVGYPVQYGDKQVGVVAVYRDISSQKDTQSQFQEFLDNIETLALILDTRGRVAFANRHVADLVGVPRQDLLGMDWFETCLPEEAREGNRHVFESVLSSSSVRVSGASPVRTPHGPRLISWSNALLRDRYGRPSGVASLGMDVTDQMAEREGLGRRERILGAVSFAADRFLRYGDWEAEIGSFLEKIGRAADASRTYVFRVSGESGGRLVVEYSHEWCSPGIESRTWDEGLRQLVLPESWQSELLQGRSIDGIVREMHGEERAILERHSVKSVHVEPVFCGTRLWGFIGFNDCRLERVWSPEESDALHAAANILGAAIQRRQVEGQLRTNMAQYMALMENLGAGVLAESSDHVILFANSEFCRMFRLSSCNDLIGLQGDLAARSVSQLFADPQSFLESTATLSAGGAPVSAQELQMKSGVLLERDYVPIRQGSELLGHLWLYRDVTEIRRSEQNALRAQKLDSLGILAGGIAHDFNNLLTAILGNVSLARMALDDPDEVARKLEEAEKASFRARALTQQLLTFAKGGRPVKKLVDVARILREVVDFVLSGGKVRCEFRIRSDLWPVEADPEQLAQALSNIALNAQQAMPSGGSITVAASNLDLAVDTPPVTAGCYVHMTIADQGPGIPEEMLPRIFDPYFTTRQDGLGLGLAASYSIVTKHGGHVVAESKPGRGTTIHVYMPASPQVVQDASEQIDSDITGHGQILVVDDDEMILMVAMDMLTALGYRVETASDGESAETLARQASSAGRPFDVAVLDLTIPGGPGGIEIANRLREIVPGIRLVVSSGYSNDPVLGDPSGFGFDGVATKPYRIEDLGMVLKMVMTRPPCSSRSRER